MLFKNVFALIVAVGAVSASAAPGVPVARNFAPAEALGAGSVDVEKRQGGGYRCAPADPCGPHCLREGTKCCGQKDGICEFLHANVLTAGWTCKSFQRCHNVNWCFWDE
jgi:hypothetical protein